MHIFKVYYFYIKYMSAFSVYMEVYSVQCPENQKVSEFIQRRVQTGMRYRIDTGIKPGSS